MLINKKFAFEASHILPRHPGKCSRLHGHSYKVEVGLYGSVDEETGFIKDYRDLKAIVQPIIDEFDHQHLNWFINYPSAENIATHIAWRVHALLDIEDEFYVIVKETENTEAAWSSYITGDMERLEMPLDAGWRTPDPGPCKNIPETLELAERVCPVALSEALYQCMRLTQYRLYANSLGEPWSLLKELQQAEAADRINNGEEK